MLAVLQQRLLPWPGLACPTGTDLAGGRPGAQLGHNFDLKSGGTKLEAPKVPRIEMPKASRGMMNRGSREVVKLYNNV